MRKSIGWLWIIGFLGLLATANAQMPAPSVAGTQFDGTYALVSSVKVTQTYRTRGGQMGVCADRSPGRLPSPRVRRSTPLPPATSSRDRSGRRANWRCDR